MAHLTSNKWIGIASTSGQPSRHPSQALVAPQHVTSRDIGSELKRSLHHFAIPIHLYLVYYQGPIMGGGLESGSGSDSEKFVPFTLRKYRLQYIPFPMRRSLIKFHFSIGEKEQRCTYINR
jgi:hypothetical protein